MHKWNRVCLAIHLTILALKFCLWVPLIPILQILPANPQKKPVNANQGLTLICCWNILSLPPPSISAQPRPNPYILAATSHW